MRDYLFILLQHLTPQHLLSRLMGWLASIQTPWFKNAFTQLFISHFHVDMHEAAIEDPKAYTNFNQFFIRQLKPELRPIAADPTAIVSPADGTVAQAGNIRGDRLIQAKQRDFDLLSLLGGDETLAKPFTNGAFVTIYLAPHNYHRVHMPFAGDLKQAIFVPGKLFSVNQVTASRIPNLYSRNERLITVFDTEVGKMAVILVGAMIVGSMQTVWMDQPAYSATKANLTTPPLHLAKGAELGHFQMGSTVIVLFEHERIAWTDTLTPGSALNYGLKIGELINNVQ